MAPRIMEAVMIIITAEWVTGVNDIIIGLIPPVLCLLLIATSLKLAPSRMRQLVTALLALDTGSRPRR